MPSAPYKTTAGRHYHIAIQMDQQGDYDAAAIRYQAAAHAAGPGELRDHCLLRFRQLTLGNKA